MLVAVGTMPLVTASGGGLGTAEQAHSSSRRESQSQAGSRKRAGREPSCPGIRSCAHGFLPAVLKSSQSKKRTELLLQSPSVTVLAHPKGSYRLKAFFAFFEALADGGHGRKVAETEPDTPDNFLGKLTSLIFCQDVLALKAARPV